MVDPDVDRLAPNQMAQVAQPEEESSSSFNDGENGYFEVEKVLKHRTRLIKGSSEKLLELFIKWKNYPVGDSTWEPLYTLYDDIRSMSKSYFKKRGL